MGVYLYAVPLSESESEDMTAKFEVELDDTAVSVATAETFETGVGKLATDEAGAAWATYVRVPSGLFRTIDNWDMRIVPDSESVNGSGHYVFQAYRGGDEVIPSSGDYLFNISVFSRD